MTLVDGKDGEAMRDGGGGDGEVLKTGIMNSVPV